MTSQLQVGPEVADLPVRDSRRVPAPSPRLVSLAVLVLALAVGAAGAVLSLRPPAPRPASAPATEFSADRATARLGGIAAVPHPTGSAAAAAVRRHLVVELRTLGLDPQVQTRVAARSTEAGRSVVGTVSNVHARIPGSQPDGRVLLVAHYDSVPGGPGASDNGANVAIVLEVVRALRAGPPLRNDVDVLFTDGEEQGLLGAQGFVDSGAAGDPGRVVVVNLEARGVSGRAVMFQTAGSGLDAAVRAADPVTTSFAAAVYQVLPHDTDLSVFAAAGMRGLNFAFLDGSAHYHTPHDDLAHVDPSSVQDMGRSALATVRHLGTADLPAAGSDRTCFSLLGTVLCYPGWLVQPLAALALVAYAVLLWTGRRHGLRLRGVARAAGTFAGVLLAAIAIGTGGWWLLTRWRPDYLVGIGDIYRPGPYALAETAVLLVVLLGWYRWTRRRAAPEEVAVGVLGWMTVLALLVAVLLPGGAYLFTWSALVGAGALLLALRATEAGAPARTVAGVAAAVPAMALILPIVLLLLPTLGLALSAAPLLLVALLGATLVGAAEPLPARRWSVLGLVLVLVGSVAGARVAAAADRYDPTCPRPVSLGYVLEADTGTATWASVGGPAQPQVGALVNGPATSLEDRVPSLGAAVLSTGPAPAAGLEQPRVAVLSTDEQEGIRSVRLRVSAPADAYAVEVFADTAAAEIVAATVAGADVAGGRLGSPNLTTDWRWSFRYAAPPSKGIEVVLRTRGPGPVRLRTVSMASGLPAGVGAPVLAPDVSWIGWPALSGQSLVVRTFTV